jgi:drug/metabolite transporter (DMT)-like permease
VSLILGLVVAASYGSGDFLGGLASRQVRTAAVLLVAQPCALLGAIVVAVAFGGDVSGHDLLLGAAAGLLNVTALACLFQGFKVGQIGVVAPLAAVIAALIPVGWGLATGERPAALALVGVALAIVAGGLISRENVEQEARGGRLAVALAVGAGIGFGCSFILYGSTGRASGFWPVLAGRCLAVTGVLVVAAVSRTRPATGRPALPQAVGSGFLDVGATTLLLVAVRNGLFATTAPVAALAPAFTVFLARWFLHDRASRVQAVGLALALVALVCIAAGEQLAAIRASLLG